MPPLTYQELSIGERSTILLCRAAMEYVRLRGDEHQLPRPVKMILYSLEAAQDLTVTIRDLRRTVRLVQSGCVTYFPDEALFFRSSLFFRPSPSRLSPGRHTVFVPMNELSIAYISIPHWGVKRELRSPESTPGCKRKGKPNQAQNNQTNANSKPTKNKPKAKPTQTTQENFSVLRLLGSRQVVTQCLCHCPNCAELLPGRGAGPATNS